MYKEDLFKNKSVLVTGGRSGIGYEIARHFLLLGAKVCICSRDESALEEARISLSEFGDCISKSCDIREVDQITKLADFIEDKFEGLDILVNNAGGQFPALAENISPKGWNAVINNNLNGTFYVSNIMANKFFIPANQGTIVNIIANIFRGFPGMVHTGAARAGVENLTKTLAQEWAEYNIRVNAVAPGIILSSGLDQYNSFVQALLEQAKEEILMKRLGTVRDVSNAVCFLAGDLASYISGTTLYVDGTEHLHGNRMAMVQLFRKLSS